MSNVWSGARQARSSPSSSCRAREEILVSSLPTEFRMMTKVTRLEIVDYSLIKTERDPHGQHAERDD